jgi:catechol 2,3-dioxygenase-like lactoylglutathione lyase family enzyme
VSDSKTPLCASLYYIAIASPDPAALASWYASVMGLALSKTSLGTRGRGPGRDVFFKLGNPNTLACAGYAVKDADELARLERRIRNESWQVERLAEDTLFQPGGMSIRDPDQNEIHFGLLADDEKPKVAGLPARLQHVVFASREARHLSEFYQRVVGFSLSDIVVDETGQLKAAFLRCSSEHHSLAVFQASSNRFDHHCYEVGDWSLIRDWADRFASLNVKVEWGPGRHGPGNNLFLFAHDPDGNWLEISAELETVHDSRPVGEWPESERTLNLWGKGYLRT